MAFLVVCSTVCFSIEKHLCGTMLVDAAIFSEVEACGSKVCGEEMGPGMAIADDSCCTNQKMTVEGQDELKISFHSLDFDQQLFLGIFTKSFIYLFEELSLRIVPFEHYSPPRLVSDIQILDQVFLI